MDVNKISSKEGLLNYANKHTTVKSSLITPLIDKCEELFESDFEIATFIYNHVFFRKKKKVFEHFDNHHKQNVLSEMINIGIQNQDISLLAEIDNWFLEREDEILENLFKAKLTVPLLFNCLVYFDNRSKSFAKAIDKIKKIPITENQLILLLNSLNKVIYGILSVKLNFLKEDFGDEVISNSVYDAYKSKPELEQLRISLLKKAIRHLSQSWKIQLILDFIFEEDFNKLTNGLDESIIEWYHFEQKITEQIPFPEPLYVDFLDVEEYYPETNFEDIWDKLEASTDSFHFFKLFELLKLKIILIENGVLTNDLDFKKLLSNTLTAFYIKGLHDFGVLTKIPKMNEVFDWPSISLAEVKLYLGRFEKQFNDESPLKKLDYTVGKSSDLKKRERQAILSKAFKTIPEDDLKPYDWGPKNSPKRLESVARHIARQINNFRRIKTRNYFYAIQDWKEDLDFLKSEFYDDKCADAFIWVKV